MFRENKKSRRHFLLGASGTVLALPFLSSLSSRPARAQDDPPIRFMAIIDRYGQFPQHWEDHMDANERVDEHLYTRSLTGIDGPINRVIGPEFDDLRSKMAVIQGLDSLTKAGHNFSVPLCASKTHLEMSYDAPDTPYSIDLILEESAVGRDSAIPALRMCPGTGGRYDTPVSNSWNRIDGTASRLAVRHSDQALFEELFGVATETEAGLTESERQTLVIDGVLGEYNALSRSARIGREDQLRLDQHASALRDVQTRLNAAAGLSCDSSGMLRPANNDTLNWYRNLIDMTVTAFACGMTNIGVININHFKREIENHERSQWHGGTHEDSDEAARAKLGEVDFEAEVVSYLFHRMDSVEEANGKTVLDNSIALWTNEQARPWHQLYSIPVVIAGGAGKFRNDCLIDYRQRPLRYTANRHDFGAVGRPYNELLITIMQAMGLTQEDYRREGNEGFGDYVAPNRDLDYWAPYLANKNNPLPYLSTF